MHSHDRLKTVKNLTHKNYFHIYGYIVKTNKKRTRSEILLQALHILNVFRNTEYKNVY